MNVFGGECVWVCLSARHIYYAFMCLCVSFYAEKLEIEYLSNA